MTTTDAKCWQYITWTNGEGYLNIFKISSLLDHVALKFEILTDHFPHVISKDMLLVNTTGQSNFHSSISLIRLLIRKEHVASIIES
jgi:hypothetical protein